MRFDIPKEVLIETEGCPHAFSCLTTGKCGDKDLHLVLDFSEDSW